MSSDWTPEEVEATVEDYLAMLKAERSRQPYVKTRHNAALRERLVGRSRGAVEYKHCNISAVLSELGLPFIDGYSPLSNFQKLLYDTVEAALKSPDNRELYQLLTGETLHLPEESDPLFAGMCEEAPAISTPPERSEVGKFVGKFEAPEIRDARNRELGRKGEEFVFAYEKARLKHLGRDDLAAKVIWVARDLGDGLGYDIASFCGIDETAEEQRLLEVKTTTGPNTTPFYITRNELEVSNAKKDRYRILRLYDFSLNPRAFRLKPPLADFVNLSPQLYRASF